MIDVNIEPMRIRHIPEILEIENEVFSSPWSEDMFRFELARGRISRLYVAVLNDRVVGYLMAWFLHDEVHLINIAVAAQYQHQKLGSRLLEFLIAEANAVLARFITLEVRKSNRMAQTFYRSFHFEQIGINEQYYSDDHEDAVLLMLDLEAYFRLEPSQLRKKLNRPPAPPLFFSKKKKESLGLPPEIKLAVILGSGLDPAGRDFQADSVFSFEEVPGLAPPLVTGHAGQFRLCRLEKESCLFVLGRRHHYEGADEDIRLLMEFIRSLGVSQLIVTSAAGSLNPRLTPGRLVLIDHLLDLQNQVNIPDLIGGLPGANAGRSGTGRSPARERIRWPDRPTLDKRLIKQLQAAAMKAEVPLSRGTMACMPGPCYETPAEVRALQLIGADIVTMSAVPEINYAVGLGIRVAAVSLVTNLATGLSAGRLSHDEVLSAGHRASSDLKHLIMHFGAGRRE
jgi:purine-nucleoside phosphorylase